MGFKEFLKEASQANSNALDNILYMMSQEIELDGVVLLDQHQIIIEARQPSWREALLNAFADFRYIKEFSTYEREVSIDGNGKSGKNVIRTLYFNIDRDTDKREKIIAYLNKNRTKINLLLNKEVENARF